MGGDPACEQASESLEDAVQGAFGDELVGQLVATRPYLAAHEARGVFQPVLADPVEARGVDVDRHRRLSERVPDAVDVARAALAGVARTEVDLAVTVSVDHEILADHAARAAEADGRDVVVVEAGALPGHPREHPGVDALVLVDQLVAAVLGVDTDERLPELGAGDDVPRE